MIGKRLLTVSLLMALIAMTPGANASPEIISLHKALELAIENNPSLSAARAEAGEASADKRLADSATGPHIQLGASYTYLNKPTLFGGMEVFERNTQVNMLGLQMPLLNQEIRARRQAAGFMEQAGASGVQMTQDEVLLEVTRRFWQVQAAREHAKAAQDAVEFLNANLRQISASREAGAATRGDELRAESELAIAQDRLISAQNGIQITLAALKLAIGVNQNYEIDLEDTGLEPDDGIKLLKASDSPAVDAAQSGVKAAAAGILAARAGKNPRISLETDVLNIASGAEFPRRDGSVSAMVRLSLPVFDSGMTRAQIVKAEAQHQRADSMLRAAQEATEFQRTASLLTLNSSRTRWEATARQVASALESRRLVEIGAREGIYTQTDLLSAQSAVSMAQASRIQSLVDLKIAEAEYLVAISRLDTLLEGGY